jgi:protein-disulfide isomerase
MLTQAKALLTAAFLAAAAGFSLLPLPALAQQGVQPTPASVEMALGDRNAPFTLIEFASMSCPHCAEFHAQTLPLLKAEYIDTGKLRLVFREFPLDQPAMMGAVLARCAGPARYFPFLEVLFRSQAQWVTQPDVIGALTRIGELGGVSAAQFQACIADRELSAGILQTRLTAEQDFGVNSTPTFSIGGRKINGALPYAQFKQIIDDVMAGKPAPDDAAAGGSGRTSLYIAVGIAALLVAFAGFVLLRRPKASASGPNR